MAVVNIHEAKTTLSKLVEALISGAEHEIIIARNGNPAVRMTSIARERKPRRLGLAKGKFTVPDNIDRDNDVIAEMFNKPADW